MTEIIVHLNKEQTRQQRRLLLGDDVYVLFHEYLRLLSSDHRITLSPQEAFLSARNFASLLLALPNVKEGLDDELDDLKDDTEGDNDAMVVSMLATAILGAVRKRHADFDDTWVIVHIYSRWQTHPLFMPILEAASRKEEERWMEGQKTNLLTCELEDIGPNEDRERVIRELLQCFVDSADNWSTATIEANLLFLYRYNMDNENKYTDIINVLCEKLRIKTTTKINFDKLNEIHGNQKVIVG